MSAIFVDEAELEIERDAAAAKVSRKYLFHWSTAIFITSSDDPSEVADADSE
jgi:hypothetical protein